MFHTDLAMSALQTPHLHALRLDTHQAPFQTATAHAHECPSVDRRHCCGHRIPILINRTPFQLLLLSPEVHSFSDLFSWVSYNKTLCALTCVKWLVVAEKKTRNQVMRDLKTTLTKFIHPIFQCMFKPIQDQNSSSQVLSIATLCITYTTKRYAEVLLTKAREFYQVLEFAVTRPPFCAWVKLVTPCQRHRAVMCSIDIVLLRHRALPLISQV
ncbi:PR-1protein [Moniliophthora roreri]|nr:PR-1protein [Moniliophthora roreri]